MKALFFKLPQEKIDHLVQCTTEEFANHPYDLASMNRIIERAGVSKGGLFKYIDNKEDLYLYVLKTHFEGLLNYQRSHFSDQSLGDILDRVEALSNIAIDFYNQWPLAYAMINRALSDQSSSAYLKAISIRAEIVKESRTSFMQDLDWEPFRLSQDEILQSLEWVSAGLSALIATSTPPQLIRTHLHFMFDCLRHGIYKEATK